MLDLKSNKDLMQNVNEYLIYIDNKQPWNLTKNMGVGVKVLKMFSKVWYAIHIYYQHLLFCSEVNRLVVSCKLIF